MKTKRIYFIDAVRAYAILMMLQGHFIDTLLSVEFRDFSYTAYKVWHYFRGITAPTFYTISGLIFTYLLLKAKDKGQVKTRIKKGLSRGLMLILIGYALRIPYLRWLTGGSIGTYFMVIDVLQVIGLSLIILVLLYEICFRNLIIYSFLMFFSSLIIFTLEPLYVNYQASEYPLFFANYLTKYNGSIFTIFPWFAYMSSGAFIATFFYKFSEKKYFREITLSLFLILGLFLLTLSTNILSWLHKLFELDLFAMAANRNFLFTRLGNVLITFGVFYLIENFLKKPLILTIGQRTLSIYVIHFIILYGSFTSFGLKQIGKNLSPVEGFFGALIFLLVTTYISLNWKKYYSFLKKNLKEFRNNFKL